MERIWRILRGIQKYVEYAIGPRDHSGRLSVRESGHYIAFHDSIVIELSLNVI